MTQRQVAQLVVRNSHEHLVDCLPGSNQRGIFGGSFAPNTSVLRAEDNDRGDEQQRDRARKCSHHRIASAPTKNSFGSRTTPGEDRLTTEESTQVVSQSTCAQVTTLWRLVQTVQANRFQIT